MKRTIIIACLVLLLAATVAAVTMAGCGKTTEPTESTPEDVQTTEPEGALPEESGSTDEESRKALEEMLEQEAAKDADFDHITYERVDFAEDNEGTKWALVEARTYTKSAPDEGTTEVHILKQADGQWEQVSSGSSGYSEGVPTEVQKALDIEGQ